MTHRSPPLPDDDFSDPPPSGSDEAAAAWAIRRAGGEWTADDDADLGRWLAADAAHPAALARAERMWTELAGLKQTPELLAGQGEAASSPLLEAALARASAPASTSPIDRPSRRPPPRGDAGAVRRALIGGTSLAVMAVVAVFAATGGEPLLALRADQRTAVAQVRELTLTDGSRVRLGVDSAIAFHFNADERRIELLKGEATFDAAPVARDGVEGERRPFVVTAAAGSTRALGTRFSVERLATHTRVTGLEHQVAVTLAGASRSPTVLLPGQAVRYDAAAIGAVDSVAPDVLSAADRGLLVFERAELADVVARLNRHHVGHIAVRGDALARRQVSGVFPAKDVDGAVAAISAELGLRVMRLPGLTVLYRE